MSILAKLFGDPNKSFLKQAQQVVAEIGDLEGQLQTYSAEQLAAKTPELKTKLAAGEQLTDLLPLAFALVREASRRTLGQRHFDVQLIGGLALHQGKIAEMMTGEGKT